MLSLMLPDRKIKPSVLGDLVKYRLSLAVTLSSVTGYFIFRNSPDARLIPLISGVFLLASAAIAMNQYIERNQDLLMERTKERPLPSGKVTRESAERLFILFLISGSCILLIAGIIPFILGILTIVLYNLVYTPLKKLTILSIIPGAFVGAIPPVIGFTAAGGNTFDQRILFFALFIFLWQIPHFWILLIRYGNDYRKAGFVTLADYLNERQIRNIIFIWITLTSIILLIFTGFSDTFSKSFFYLLLALNPAFIILFHKLLFSHNQNYGQKYAFLVFTGFGILIMLLFLADSFLSVL